MRDWIANPSVWSYGIAAMAFAWIALRLVLKWQPGGKPAMLLAVTLATTAFAVASMLFAAEPSIQRWLLTHATDVLRSASMLGFLLAFLGVRGADKAAPRGGAGWALLVSVGVVLVVLQTIVGIKPPGVPDLGKPLHQAGFAVALAVATFGLLLVEQCYRRTPAAARWHVRPLLLGLGGLLAYDLVLYSDALMFKVLDADLWAARGVAQAVTVPLLLLTLRRARDWSFELTVSRTVLVGSTALGVVGAYLLLIASAGFVLRELGGSWGRALESALVFAALLLLAVVALSGTFRARLRVFVAKHFFSYRFDYREQWLRFTQTLTQSAADQPGLACIRALGDLVESSTGALWLRSTDGQFRQVAHTGVPASSEVLADEEPLVVFLRRTGWVLEISDVIARGSKYEGLRLPVAIAAAPEAWLLVPLSTSTDLVGFVVLATPRIRMDLDWEVLDLLKTAGRQAASYLAYGQATEALLEARKFDAFHRMSTFVVHDLKNLIAQLQLLLSNVERHRDNPEFQRDMLKTIEHVVGRMNKLTLQLRPEATGSDHVRQVDVGNIVRRVQELRLTGRTGLSVEAEEGTLAWAHEELLERVVAHWMQNAFEASGSAPDVTVRVLRDGEWAVVEVQDRGVGMSPEFMRDRLFRPFQTTKETGTGIGAFESLQYLQKIGGRIEVTSQPGAGTLVRIRLRAVRPVPADELDGLQTMQDTI